MSSVNDWDKRRDPSGVQVGTVIAGKYRVERVIGRGGMGVVLSARHLQLEQRVALKFMTGEQLDAETRDRFLREAQAAVRLRGEHVARVYDVGTTDDGSQYIVMEYLDGRDLGAVLSERGPLIASEAVDYVLQACVAMAEAHARGVIHRDLKPGNLFLTYRPDGAPLIKVLDFGVSKMTKSGMPASVTATAAFMGSPAYMSPEQMKSAKHVGPPADIWSLGAILYELLSAELPFACDSVPEICAMVFGEPPHPLRAIAPGVSERLESVILHCLEKRPDDRYQNVGELATALSPFASSHGRRHVESISEMLRSGLGIDSLTQPPQTPSTVRTRGGVGRRTYMIGGAVLVAAGAVGVGLTLARGTHRERPAGIPTEATPTAITPPRPDVQPLPAVIPDAGARVVAPVPVIDARPRDVIPAVTVHRPPPIDARRREPPPVQVKEPPAGHKPPDDPFGTIQ